MHERYDKTAFKTKGCNNILKMSVAMLLITHRLRLPGSGLETEDAVAERLSFHLTACNPCSADLEWSGVTSLQGWNVRGLFCTGGVNDDEMVVTTLVNERVPGRHHDELPGRRGHHRASSAKTAH